jgi:hypothetical protein
LDSAARGEAGNEFSQRIRESEFSRFYFDLIEKLVLCHRLLYAEMLVNLRLHPFNFIRSQQQWTTLDLRALRDGPCIMLMYRTLHEVKDTPNQAPR